MNKIFMILVTLLLVSCAENNNSNNNINSLLDNILSSKEDPNTPIVNLNDEIIPTTQLEKTEHDITPTMEVEKEKSLTNLSTPVATTAALISISDEYCVNNKRKSEYKNELKRLASVDNLNASIVNKLLKCYDTNITSKKQQNSCIVYVCKQEIDKAKTLIGKEEMRGFIDIGVNEAQEVVDQVKQNNLNALNKKKITTPTDITDPKKSVDKIDTTTKINTANTANTANTVTRRDAKKTGNERNILLQEARAGRVESSSENLSTFCRLSSQLVFYTTNNIIMDLNNTAPRSNMSTLPQVGMINIENSFAYKALKITEDRLSVIKEKLMSTLPFTVVPHDDTAKNYQASYYANCLESPNKYIFNYSRIFKPSMVVNKLFQ